MISTSILRTILTRSFRPFVFKHSEGSAPFYQDEKNLGLYVHIPFCRSLCPFCPYCKVLFDRKLADDYVAALLKEIEMTGKSWIDNNKTESENPKLKTNATKRQVTSLYFGGGSPALLYNKIELIISQIKKYFDISGGIGLELHPLDVTKELLSTLKKAGITMISVGIQSFDETCLSNLGRKQIDYEKIFSDIRDANFDVVDTDLIFAIPGQTEKSLLCDIEKAFTLGATQISTYPFIDFTYANNIHKPLSEKVKKEMLKAISLYCKNTNRNRTSVWTFAKQGTQKYSSVTRDSFLGFGISATTLLNKSFRINTFSIPDYIDRINNGCFPTSLECKFSLRQRAVYYLFWSAYGMKVNTKKFLEFFNIPLEKLYSSEMNLCLKLGFATKENTQDGVTYTLTDKGAYYYHFAEQKYTRAYIDKMWNISRIIPFPKKIVLR